MRKKYDIHVFPDDNCIPKPLLSFKELLNVNLNEINLKLFNNLKKWGIKRPLPVQMQCIPIILSGYNYKNKISNTSIRCDGYESCSSVHSLNVKSGNIYLSGSISGPTAYQYSYSYVICQGCCDWCYTLSDVNYVKSYISTTAG